MPIKLVAPREGQKSYFMRGTYLGVLVNQSTKTDRKAVALKILKQREQQIERSILNPTSNRTFLNAAVAYMEAGGDARPLGKLIEYFGEKPLSEIGQIEIDQAAATLFPAASSATRNREVYTPVAAVLHRAGVEKKIRRPKGWRGNRSTSWLTPDQAFAVFEAADAIDLEFGLFLRTLCYTGMRLSECLGVTLRHVNLRERMIYLPDTKNGEPRAVYMPSHLVAAFANQPPREERRLDAGVPFMDRAPDRRLFRFTPSGALRDLLKEAFAKCALVLPRRQAGFHIFCHTYASWMRKFGGLDNDGLVRTGRWKDRSMADRYVHTAPGEDARKADLLPIAGRKAI